MGNKIFDLSSQIFCGTISKRPKGYDKLLCFPSSSLRKRLFAETVPANMNLFARTIVANKNLFAAENKHLFAGPVPANKNLFDGTQSVGSLNIFHLKHGFLVQ